MAQQNDSYFNPNRSKTDSRQNNQQKKSKRSKQEEKKWKKKMKEIGKNHPEFELSYDLLLGIRTSTSTVNSSIMRSSINTNTNKNNNTDMDSSGYDDDDDDDISNDDEDDEYEIFEKEFKDSKRYSFPSSGSSQTPPHHMNDFEFKDYCRPIFAQLREWFGIKPQTYLVKLCGSFNLLEFISNSKSGQFFFYSHDGQFLIKSMARSECKLMRKILPPYYYYVKNQPNTLLTKFYGMYRVKTHNRQPIYFIVMGSVFYTELDIHRIYDLKGSTHGRKATDKEKKQDTPVLKDLDFIENNEILQIGHIKAKLFCEQLRRDTQLLRKLKIMDYSLLVGIHYTDRPPMPMDPDIAIDDIDSINSMNSMNSSNEEKEHSTHSNDDSIDVHVDDGIIKPPKINESHTTESNGPQIEFSLSQEQDEDKQDNFKEEKVNINININRNVQSTMRPPPLSRVASRRISQITTNITNRFTVKTPLEKNFDMPELLNFGNAQRMYNKAAKFYEDEEEDEHANIFAKDEGGMQFITDDGNYGNIIFFCGIIDILQKYNKRKKVENFFRGLNTDTATISAVPPEQYSQRMYQFLKERIK